MSPSLSLRSSSSVLLALTLSPCAMLHAQSARYDAPLHLSGSTAIGPAAGTQRNAVLAQGNTSSLLVYEDSRAGDRDIYGARVDAQGALIDAAPFPITHAPGDQTAPRVAWNGTNWLVVYASQVDPGSGYFATEVACVRVSSAGAVLDTNRIRIGEDSSGATYAVGSDGLNWVVTMAGYSGGTAGLVAKRVSASGTVLDPAGVAVLPSGSSIIFGAEITYAQGTYLFSWSEGVRRGRRFDTSMRPLDAGVRTLPVEGGAITSNGLQHFALWMRQTPAFTSEIVGARLDAQLNRLDAQPIAISGANPTANQTEPRVVWDGAQWIALWLSYASLDMRCARVSATGSVLDPGGVLVPDQAPSYLYGHALGALPGGGALATWHESRFGTADDVFGVPFSAAAAMGTESIYSLGAEALQAPRVGAGPDHYLVTARGERADGTRVLSWRVDASGVPLDAQPILVASASHALLHAGGSAWNGALHLVTYANASDGWIYARRLDRDGAWIDPAPFRVLRGAGADVAALQGDFLVVGVHAPGYPQYVSSFGARVRGSDGAVLDATPLALAGSYATRARVAILGGQWLVATEQHWSHNQSQGGISTHFVTSAGAITAGSGMAVLTIQNWGSVDLASSGNSALIVSQSGSNWTNTDIFVQRLLPDGSSPQGMRAITTSAPAGQHRASVAWNGEEYVVAFESYQNNVWGYDFEPDVYAQRLREDGSSIDTQGFALWSSEDYETHVDQEGLGAGRSLVAAAVIVDADYAGTQIALRAQRPRGVASYGTGTAGCTGPERLDANGPVVPGNAAFALRCAHAPESSLGALLLSRDADLAGS
ncbi:MAG: hypothetical protein JNM84_04470, partial [Planctomycetes bacterium]|nr:hypothetical protein [Planctomycetota bacterium]